MPRPGDVPVYLVDADVHSVLAQHRRAAARGGRAARESGVLREETAFEISCASSTTSTDAVARPLVARWRGMRAARGVVGLVDFDMAWNGDDWARRLAGGFDILRVEFGVYPQHLDRAIAEGLRTGDPVRGATSRARARWAAQGHHRRFARHAHGRVLDAYPGCPAATTGCHGRARRPGAAHARATGAGLTSAIHAIGDIGNSHALDAFAAIGCRGTIEHAQLRPHADIPRFAALGIGACVQPEHAMDDRDLTDRSGRARRRAVLLARARRRRARSSLFGSDAPVAPLDPWAAIAAAVVPHARWTGAVASRAGASRPRRRSPPRPRRSAAGPDRARRHRRPRRCRARSARGVRRLSCAGCRSTATLARRALHALALTLTADGG